MKTTLGHHGLLYAVFLYSTICLLIKTGRCTVTSEEKAELKNKVVEMFRHAYNSYMNYAYPADELMPLSCKGRYRGSEPDRGDIDEALGNFSLTLIDSLDTLAVIGDIKEFDRAVRLVIDNVSFNADAVVSVFETNIRVLGGLLGAHSVAVALKESGKGMDWYTRELLDMAEDVGDRLLLAFNTTTGIPYPKVNLRYGVHHPSSRTGDERDTCTACAGTMIMEFGALSRMTGRAIFELKARKAMEAIWHYRSRNSDLVGTVINIHNGDWVRRDSGIGAGIDSYYEYCLKAYILLGDESYLQKFNTHYSAINRYIRQGSMMLDVLMNQPERPVRSFMDSLQAFWPGLQVLLGDLKPAIETHEMLYEVAKRHKFLPEAFTTNYDVYWAQHPLRPEFIESTYFLHEATKDPYYLEVGKHVIESLEEHARVPCGFAAMKDVRILSHEDKMDSFVLAETFKYLYLMFSEESERVLNVHDFVFTTEAHLLPLWISNLNASGHTELKTQSNHTQTAFEELDYQSSCPNTATEKHSFRRLAEMIRKDSRKPAGGTCPNMKVEEKIGQVFASSDPTREPKLRAEHFQVGNQQHLQLLKEMGISISQTSDGKVQLMHQAVQAVTAEDAQDGIKFMQDMIQIAKTRGDQQIQEDNLFQKLLQSISCSQIDSILKEDVKIFANSQYKPRIVQVLSPPHSGKIVFTAGPAQFGVDLGSDNVEVSAEVVEVEPFKACSRITNPLALENRIVLMERGECMFIDKVRQVQAFGALGAIIIDHNEGTSSDTQPTFAMSGDSHPEDITIASVFLFRKEGQLLRQYMRESKDYLQVRIASRATTVTGKNQEGHRVEKPADESHVKSTAVVSEQKCPDPVTHTDKTEQVKSPVHVTKKGSLQPLEEFESSTKEGEKTTTSKEEYIGKNNDGKLVKFVVTTSTICNKENCEGGPERIFVSSREEPLPSTTAQFKGSLFRKADKLADEDTPVDEPKEIKPDSSSPLGPDSINADEKETKVEPDSRLRKKTGKRASRIKDSSSQTHTDGSEVQTVDSQVLGEKKAGNAVAHKRIKYGDNGLSVDGVYNMYEDGEEEEIIIPPGMVFCPEQGGPCKPEAVDEVVMVKSSGERLNNGLLTAVKDVGKSVDDLQKSLKAAEKIDLGSSKEQSVTDRIKLKRKRTGSKTTVADTKSLEPLTKTVLPDEKSSDDKSSSSGFIREQADEAEKLKQDLSKLGGKNLESHNQEFDSGMRPLFEESPEMKLPDQGLSKQNVDSDAEVGNDERSKEPVICTSSGCFSSLDELAVFNKLVVNVKNQLHQLEVESLKEAEQVNDQQNEKKTDLTDTGMKGNDFENSKDDTENTKKHARTAR